jgi:uncharacterized membrane protein YdjX (TVP38/TMEM64 family)
MRLRRVSTIVTTLLMILLIISSMKNIDNIIFSVDDYGDLAPILFIVIVSIASNLFVPLSIMVISGGVVFGSFYGFIYSFIGGAISILLGFWITTLLNIKNSENFHDNFNFFLDGLPNHGFLSVVLIRLTAIPFALQNFLSSVLDVPFRIYFSGSILGMIPWLLVLNLFGDSVMKAKYYAVLLSIVLLVFLYRISYKLSSANNIKKGVDQLQKKSVNIN